MRVNPRFRLPLLLLAAGAAPLMVALVAQYGAGLRPCHFCLLQRYPYVVVFFCGAAIFAFRSRIFRSILSALAVLSLWVTAMLGAVHAGIEAGWLHYTGGCVADRAAPTSLEALRAQIAGAPLVACDEVAASFLGLSMAGWNALGALALSVLIIVVYRRYEGESYGKN